ncbi:kinetochore and Eb1-associated basic protein [Drosophila willistoni]|uniref:kinetochore and Eb1-associated basic protein n=1 Tax=Drosophila willistoni TaxID=7260 RepID=UPI001F0822FF|nr:kinetochore and Eb1-associated basic protein [Drosophila willistoni]
MDIEPKRTEQLLLEQAKTPTTHERCPTIIITPDMMPRSEPRPLRTKELLERQQQEELIRRTSNSASKILKEPLKAKILMDGIDAPYSYTSYYPIRTKELLERQRQEEFGRRSAFATRYCSKTSAKRPPNLIKTPINHERNPTIVITSDAPLMMPRTEPRPLRTRELLERQQQEELNRRTCKSASKILKEPLKAKTSNDGIESGPTYTAFYPIRTKELLERQRQEELCRQTASGTKISSTGSENRTPNSGIAISRRALTFTQTPDRPTHEMAKKIKELASQLRQVHGLQSITESKLRQLTIMDFLSILNHTLPWSGAIARDFRLDKSSYVSETVKALERLKYPHKVSKTYLKMPGTRHGLNATIDIIEFLVDFGLVGNMSKIYKLSNNETEATSQLHSDEKVKLDSVNHELKNFSIDPKLAQVLSEKNRIEKDLSNTQNALKTLFIQSADCSLKFSQLFADRDHVKKNIEKYDLTTLLKQSAEHSLKLSQLYADQDQLMKNIENLQNVIQNENRQAHELELP